MTNQTGSHSYKLRTRPFTSTAWTNRHIVHAHSGLYSLSGRTSYRKISWSLDVARLDVITIVWLWNLTGISASLLTKCLSNFKAIGKVWTRISPLRDFTRFCGKTSVNWGPAALLHCHNASMCATCSTSVHTTRENVSDKYFCFQTKVMRMGFIGYHNTLKCHWWWANVKCKTHDLWVNYFMKNILPIDLMKYDTGAEHRKWLTPDMHFIKSSRYQFNHWATSMTEICITWS